MDSDAQTLIDAGRLIQWALRPHVRPATTSDYQQLLDRYRGYVPFRECVQAICTGLGIEISAEGPQGLVLAPGNDSVFAMGTDDYRRSGSADDRLIDGLILVGIIATMYPRPEDLEGDPDLARPPITVEEVEKTLRTLCEHLEEASQKQPDPAAQELTAGLDEAWRSYRDRVATKTTSNGRAATGTTLQMISRAFDTLKQHDCVTMTTRNNQKMYRPTWKYQAMIRDEGITRLASAVRELLGEK